MASQHDHASMNHNMHDNAAMNPEHDHAAMNHDMSGHGMSVCIFFHLLVTGAMWLKVINQNKLMYHF